MKTVILIFLVAISMRFALSPLPTIIAPDSYREIAHNILAGNGFSRAETPPFEPDSVRTPLYPLFIAAVVKIFGSYNIVFLIQIIIGSLSAVIAYLIAKEFLPPKWALTTGLLAALEPYTAYLSSTLVTETLFTFFFLWAVYLFLKYLNEKKVRHIILVALLLGIATLIRPTTQYLPYLLVIIIWLSNHRRCDSKLLKHSLLLIGISCLILSPWMYRNYTLFKTAELTVQPYSNLYAYLVPSVIALEKNISYEEAAEEFFARENVSGIEDVTLSNGEEFRARAITELWKHPRGIVESLGVTVWGFFTNDGYASMLSQMGIPISFQHPPVSELVRHPTQAFEFLKDSVHGFGAIPILGRIFWIMVTILTATGSIIFVRRHGLTARSVFVLGLIAYFILTSAVIGLAVNGRFRVPVNPLIFILALIALKSIYEKVKHHSPLL